jgi:hypothetical protein
MKKWFRRTLGVAAVALPLTAILWAQGHDDNPDFPVIPWDHPAIKYTETEPNDAVARLQKQIEAGKVKLEYTAKWGYLPAILKALDINVDSQMLVFSRTSAQVGFISMETPRAVYFNDHTALGFVQRSNVLEVTSIDPKLGAIFYTFDNAPPEPGGDPGSSNAPRLAFSQQFMNCLQCHMTPATLNIPGIVVSSSRPLNDLSPYGGRGAFATDHRLPLASRWGGWYVTGQHGKLRHRGNTPVDFNPFQKNPEKTQNLESLADLFDTSAYLAPTSDIVALLTVEHQTHMVNLIIRLGWETRVALQEGTLREFEPRMKANVEELVTYMLFADEEPFPDPIAGNSTFTKTFAQRGPRDKQGRSLRDFDLQRRLFKYPLSFVIYSDVFDALPDLARNAVYRRVFDVLTGTPEDEPFGALSAEARRAAYEILRDTKKGLPEYWKTGTPAE